MAFEIPLFSFSADAGADLSAAQYKFVKLNSSGQVVVCSAVTDIPVGILQNKPDTAGKSAEVMAAGISKVQGDANLAMGDQVGTSADGQAAAYVNGTDTTKYIVGQVLLDNAAAAGLASILFNCMNPGRGA